MESLVDVVPDIESVAQAIGHLVVETPLLHVEGRDPRESVWVKLESLQRTGSFKVRGAASRLTALTDDAARRGVVACSSGNHGRAVAYVAQRLGLAATVCVPEWVDPSKVAAMRAHGATTHLHGATYDAAELEAARLAREDGLVLVHPFDDPMVIAGQGTVGREIAAQLPSVDTVVLPLSGGGLVAGVATALRRHRADIRIVAASAEQASVMFESIRAGHPVERPEQPTVANALSGGIGLDNRYTFSLVEALVDEHVLVTEDAVQDAMRWAAQEHNLILEGGGAVALAAWRSGQVAATGQIALVASGGNIDRETWLEVIR